MKRRIVITLLFSLLVGIGITACGGESSSSSSSSSLSSSTSSSLSSSSSSSSSTSSSLSSSSSSSSSQPDDSVEIMSCKLSATEKLDELVNPAIAKINDEDLRQATQTYYNNEKQYIDNIVDLEVARAAVEKVISDTIVFAKEVLKPLAISKLNDVINPLIQQISDEELKLSVQSFYDIEMSKIASIESLDDVVTIFKEILEDTKQFIIDETEKLLTELKNQALEELDPYVTALIAKIPYETLRVDTQAFYINEKKKLEAVDAIEEVKPCLEEIKDDLEGYVVIETKKLALEELDSIILPIIEKIEDEALENSVKSFYTQEKQYINAIENVDSIKDISKKIADDSKEFATITLKPLAISKLNDVINPLIQQISDEELKLSVQSFYDTEMNKIASIESLDDVVTVFKEILEDTQAFIIQETEKLLTELKNQALEELDPYVTELIDKIPYESLRVDTQAFYANEKKKLEAVDAIEEVKPCLEEIKDDLEGYVVSEAKKLALEELDKIILPIIEKIEDSELETSVKNFYTQEKQYINTINDLDSIKDVSKKIANDTKEFATITLKPLAISKLNDVINPLIEQISDEELRLTVQSFYDTEMSKIASIESLDDVVTIFKEILEDTKQFIIDETEKVLTELKNKALEELDPYVIALVDKIPYESLRVDTQAFYANEKKKLEAVDAIDEIAPCVNEIKEDLEGYVVVEAKKLALEELDSIILPIIEKIEDEALENSVKSFYNQEKQYINAINDLDSIKDISKKIADDSKEFALVTLKPLAISKLNEVINPLIEQINDSELRASVQSFYDTEMSKIASIESLDDVVTIFKEILEDTKAFIIQETEKLLTELKNQALEELDPYVTELIAKIPYETLRVDTQAFYINEKKKLEAVDAIDEITPCVNEIKEDLMEFALIETKKFALSGLEDVVEEGLSRIPNKELRDDLTAFSQAKIAELNEIDSIQEVHPTFTRIVAEIEEYITELLASIIREYIERLTAIETATAYDYIPEAMHPAYYDNLVNGEDVDCDFTSFVKTSNINKAGFGEQWQMVIANIEQSIKTAKVFNVAQTFLSSAGNAIDIYLSNSYSEEIEYSFGGEGYTARFEYKEGYLIFNLNILQEISVPGFGSVYPIIKMEYDLLKDAKGMYISLGENAKIKYVITEDSYELATKYGVVISGKNGTRTSYLCIDKSTNKTEGHIYEYTSLEGSDLIQACADFYVENGYVSVVGNKASGMLVFDGYVNELYLESEGRLLGYEVREELTFAGITGTYNTLWFNIWDIEGIDNVKVTDKTSNNESGKSNYDVYLNNSSKMLSPTYNKLVIKTSRKYDIELRSRYYYSYDAEAESYVAIEVEVPMMFVQEGDNFASFESDVKKDNGLNLSVALNTTYLNKILADYDTLIDIFITNKDAMSSELIIAYLKQYE